MGNDVTLFKNGVPEHLKNRPLNAITKSLLGGGANTKQISLRGNLFRMMVGGKEIAVSEDRSMKVVVVGLAAKVHRTWYAGAFDPEAKAAPSCWSADGDRPDATIAAPQSDKCATCEKNIAGSGANGKGRACRFGRMAAVVLDNDVEGDAYRLSIPAQSLFGDAENGNMPLNAYGQFLGGFNVNVTDVVTEMRFDTNSATPKLFFKAVRPLTPDELDTCTARGETAEVKALVKVSFQPASEVAAEAKPSLKQLAKPKAQAADEPEDEDEEAEAPQPQKRASKKETVAAKPNLSAVLDKWDDAE
jgi:hypothetical protein